MKNYASFFIFLMLICLLPNSSFAETAVDDVKIFLRVKATFQPAQFKNEYVPPEGWNITHWEWVESCRFGATTGPNVTRIGNALSIEASASCIHAFTVWLLFTHFEVWHSGGCLDGVLKIHRSK